MKTTKALFSTALAFGVGMAALSTGHASVAVGTNSEGFLTGTIGFEHADNIFLTDTNDKSSGIFTLEPGVAVEFGTDALAVNTLTITEEFLRYTSASSQNNELAHINYDGTYDGPPYRISTTMGFNQYARNTRDAVLPGMMVENEVFDVDLLFEWDVEGGYLGTPLTMFDLGLSYEENSYEPSAMRDRRIFSLPFNAYFPINDALDYSIGYRYQSATLRRAPDRDGHFFNLGFRGEFSPKLNGTVRAGYITSDIDAFGLVPSKNISGFGFEGEFDYAYSEQVDVNVKIGNDYSIAATGHTQEALTIDLGVMAAVNDNVSLDGGLSYGNYVYKQSPRDDDYWTFTLGGKFRLNEYFDLHARYTFQDNSSNQVGASFDNNSFQISTSFRY